MFKFDIRYKIENYLEYYRFALVKSKMYRDFIFSALFIAVGVYWLVDQSDATANIVIPIVAFVLAVLIPLSNFTTLPLIKKQLKRRQSDLDRTHIVVTFNEDNIIYENLTEPVTKVEAKEEKTENVEETASEEVKETPTEEPKEETKPEENIFEFKYDNFMLVRELAGLYVFYISREQMVLVPKETLVSGNSFEEFNDLLTRKVYSKRLKLLKAKKVEEK